ncbi:MAG: DUF2273 domain-containing protein [Peptococcia bacterium]|jgi:uncharacterized membrane protein
MLEQILAEIFKHRGKVLGLIAGLVFGLMVIKVGFWQTLFITLCLGLGYAIGKRIDDNESLKEVIERIIKER